MKKYITLCLCLWAATNTLRAQDPIAAANKCYDEKNYACAAEQYKKALQGNNYQEKDHATILFRIGYALGESNSREESVRYFKDAISIRPDYGDAYWSMGGNYYNLNDYDNAIASYTQAIRLFLNDAKSLKTLYYWRGSSYLQVFEDSLALSDFVNAIQIDSTVADYYVEAGEASYNLGHYDDAVWYYRKSIKLGDEDKKVIAARYYWVAESYFRMEEYEDALGNYRKALDFDPASSSCIWGAAECDFNLGRYSDAITDYDKVIPLYKNDTISLSSQYYFRGRSFTELKQYDKALADYDACLKLNPAYKDAAWQKAAVTYRQKKYREAIPLYTRTIELFKGDSKNLDDIYYFRGYCYLLLKDTADARKDFLQSLAFNSSLRDPNIQMGNLSYAAGKYYEAKDYYSNGINGYKTDSAELSALYFRKGFSNILAGDTYFYTGKEDLLKSISYDSTNKEAHRYLADAYYRQNLFAPTETELNKCIHLYKNVKDSLLKMYTYRALARWQQKNFQGALEDYEQVDKLKKIAEPATIKSMGQLAFEVKAYGKASGIFTRLIPLYKPEQKDELMFAYYARGRSLFELKQKDAAVKDFKKALELVPDNKEAKDWLTKAEAL